MLERHELHSLALDLAVLESQVRLFEELSEVDLCIKLCIWFSILRINLITESVVGMSLAHFIDVNFEGEVIQLWQLDLIGPSHDLHRKRAAQEHHRHKLGSHNLHLFLPKSLKVFNDY